MLSFFKELFEYNRTYNKHFIECILASNYNEGDSIKLINHIHQAHRIWNTRLMSSEEKYEVWGEHDIDKLIFINEENYSVSIHIISNMDLSSTIDYRNTKGQTYSNSIRDILFHVINHSTHHRAQIARDLRQHGIAPPISDYIFFKRNS